MGKVWGIVNRKGGVGKTTTATTLSYLLAKEGYKVALLDFDGQRHSTKLCGVMSPEQLSITIYDILKFLVAEEALPEKESYIIRTDAGVDLIPASNRLDNFDKLMCDTDFAEYKLKEYVDTIKGDFDYIQLNKIENLVNPHEIKENSTSLGNPKKLDAGTSVSEEYGLSKDRIAKYLRIATLIPPLLESLDTKVLGFEAAYDISFVNEEMQPVIAELMAEENLRLDTKKSSLIHNYAKNGTLTEERIRQIITGEKTKKPKGSGPRPIQIKAAVITRFFAGEQNP